MSSFRRTSTNNAGDSIVYGANDFHVIVDLLNGTVSDIPPVKFKSTSGVKFWDGVLKLRDVSDSFDLTIKSPTLTANRNLILPNLTGNDTAMVITFAQTPTNKTIKGLNNFITDTSMATGDILKSNATKFVRLARGSSNQILMSTGSDLAWTTLSSTNTNIKLDDVLAPDNNTDLDATTLKHGLLPRLSGVSTNFFNAMGEWVDPPGTVAGETNTMSNIGTAGVGLYKQKTVVNFEIKKINAGSNKITITDDTSNNEVDIDLVEANLTLTSLGGALDIDNGGTGQTSQTAAFDALAPTVSQGDLIYHNGTDNVRFPKGSSNQYLKMNSDATGLEWVGADTGTTLISQDFTAASITNTVAETNLFLYTIPANTLPTRAVEVEIETDALGNTGTSQTSTIRIYHGATKVFDDVGKGLNDADILGLRYRFLIWRDTTNANNRITGEVYSNETSTPTTGRSGDFDQDEMEFRTIFDCATNTESITANKDFKVTLQHSTASTSFYVKRIYSRVIHIGMAPAAYQYTPLRKMGEASYHLI